MLLTLVIILIAVQAKRPYVIVISALILHTLSAWISSFAISGLDEDVAASALASLLIGVFLQKWLARKKHIHGFEYVMLLKKKITGGVTLMLLMLGTVCVWNVFLAIEKAENLIRQAKTQIVVYGPNQAIKNTKIDTRGYAGSGVIVEFLISNSESDDFLVSVMRDKMLQEEQEMTGFGIIQDTETVNAVSGEITDFAVQRKKAEIAEQRGTEWTLLDEALTTSNSLYSVASSMAIELGATTDPNFDARKVPGLLDNIPSRFMERIANSGSLIEAYAKRAYIQEYLQNQEKLMYSGLAGKIAMLVGRLVDF